MQLYISINTPHQWITLDDNNAAIIASGEAHSLDDLKFDQPIQRVSLIADASKIASHRVNVPGTSRKNVVSAIPFVLEEELTDDIEDLHFALQQWSPNELADVLVVKDQYLSSSMKQFSSSNLAVDDIVPEYLLLPLHPSADVTLARLPSDDYLIRTGIGSGTIVDESMLELWWDIEAKDKVIAINDEQMVKDLIAQGWENVQYWDIGNTPAQWIKNGGLNKLAKPCLLQGKYDDTEQNQTRFDYKMAVNFMLAGIGIYVCSIIANHFYLSYKSTRLESQAVEMYETAFPELSGQSIDDPIYEFRKAISALGSGNYQSDNFLSILQVIANQLQNTPNTSLTNLIFEEGVLKAEVVVLDFAALDALYISLANTTQGYATVATKDAAAQDDVVKGILEVTLTQG